MLLIHPLQSFSLNYPTADQTSSLFVRANIYDISSGSAILLGFVNMTERIAGVYSALYTGASTKTYLAIATVYTDGTYATVDTNFAPGAEIYKSLDAPSGFMAFNYGAYDQDPTLFIAGSIYDNTLSFVAKVSMAHVFAGVYVGVYTGMPLQTYEVVKLSYSDGTYTVIDLNRGPGTDTIQIFTILSGNSVLFGPAVLEGQLLGAQLTAQSLSATLIGECV